MRQLELSLSNDESARAARFRFRRDRDRFVAARGVLRNILARYSGTPAGALRFSYGAHGKPFLAEPGPAALRFNIAHSGDTLLVAVAVGRDVGVDVECARPDIEIDPIVATALSIPERSAVQRHVGYAKQAAFLRVWTRKEAYIKADGRGASLPLDRIDVSNSLRPKVALLPQARCEWQESSRWMLATLESTPERGAALAVEGSGWCLDRWQWPELAE